MLALVVVLVIAPFSPFCFQIDYEDDDEDENDYEEEMIGPRARIRRLAA